MQESIASITGKKLLTLPQQNPVWDSLLSNGLGLSVFELGLYVHNGAISRVSAVILESTLQSLG